jgi:hypothetical protein
MWAVLLEFLGPLGALLSRLVFSRAGMWVVSALVFLGIGFATQTFAVDAFRDYMQTGFSGLTSQAAQWIGFFNVDRYCTILLSAYAAAFSKKLILRKITG